MVNIPVRPGQPVSQALPTATAVAGPFGLAHSNPAASAIVGPGGVAIAFPTAGAIAGPGGVSFSSPISTGQAGFGGIAVAGGQSVAVAGLPDQKNEGAASEGTRDEQGFIDAAQTRSSPNFAAYPVVANYFYYGRPPPPRQPVLRYYGAARHRYGVMGVPRPEEEDEANVEAEQFRALPSRADSIARRPASAATSTYSAKAPRRAYSAPSVEAFRRQFY